MDKSTNENRLRLTDVIEFEKTDKTHGAHRFFETVTNIGVGRVIKRTTDSHQGARLKLGEGQHRRLWGVVGHAALLVALFPLSLIAFGVRAGLRSEFSSCSIQESPSRVVSQTNKVATSLIHQSRLIKGDEKNQKTDGPEGDNRAEERISKEVNKLDLSAVTEKLRAALKLQNLTAENQEKDPNGVKELLKKNPMGLYSASGSFKNNRELVLELVKIDGNCLQYASKELKDDEEIVRAAMKNYQDAIKDASSRVQDIIWKSRATENQLEEKDIETMTMPSLLQEITDAIPPMSKEEAMQTILTATPQQKNDKTFVEPFLTLCPAALEHVSVQIKRDEELVLKLVEMDGSVLAYAGNVLKNKKSVVLPAVKNDGLALEYASPLMKKNKEVARAALKQNPKALDFVDQNLKNDPEFMKSIKGNGN
jgi:hypothetical protein